MSEFKFDLGLKVTDIISGYSGVITGRAQYLTGCNTYAVNSQKLLNEKPIDSEWFDENRLEKIGSGINLKTGAGINDNGPDNRNPDGSNFRRS